MVIHFEIDDKMLAEIAAKNSSPRIPEDVLQALRCCEVTLGDADCEICPFNEDKEGELVPAMCRGLLLRELKKALLR